VKSPQSVRFTTRVLSGDMHPLPQVDLCRRGELRVEKFLDAATEVFREKGYQHAKLSEIVARAGGSLATLYRVFGDKEGLAYAIVDRRLQAMSAIMDGLDLEGLPPEEGLRAAAERYTRSNTTEDAHLVHRLVIGEGHSFPALRDWFFANALASISTHLATYLHAQQQAGHIVLRNSPEQAALQFFDMLFGDLILRTSCGHLLNPNPEEVRQFAMSGVETFLYGVLPR
jgi:AcrR family transcriptional regulator